MYIPVWILLLLILFFAWPLLLGLLRFAVPLLLLLAVIVAVAQFTDPEKHRLSTQSESQEPVHTAQVVPENRKANSNAVVRVGDTQRWGMLVNALTRIDERDAQGGTSLFRYSFDENLERLDFVLREGANPNVISKNGLTPLRQAAMLGQALAVDRLLRSGADPGYSDKNGNTAVRDAAHAGYSEIVYALVAAGADYDLESAIALGDIWKVSELLEAGADPNSRVNADRPLLVFAAFFGKTSIVKALLENGAEVNLLDQRGESALWHAAAGGHFGIAKLLLKHDATVDAANRNGVTPLMGAAFGGHIRIMELLIDAGAEVQAVAHDSERGQFSAYTLANEKGWKAAVDLLASPNNFPSDHSEETVSYPRADF